MPAKGGSMEFVLPDGSTFLPPADALDYAELTPASATRLNYEVGGTVAFHRQRPLFIGLSTSATAIPNNTQTLVPMNSELVDNYYGHTDASNSSRWWAQESNSISDWYLVSGYCPVSYTGGTAASFITGLRLTGAGTVYEGNKISATSGHVVNGQVIDLVEMDAFAEEYVQLMAWQNTGASQNTGVSGKCPSLHVRYILSTPIDPVSKPGTLHTWIDDDQATADATGASPAGGSGVKVPLNREIRDVVKYLNCPPTARITSQGTAQTIAASTWTAINMVTESLDTHGMWAAGQPSRIVCQQAGLYLIAGLFAVDADATPTGYVQARLRHTILAGGTADYYGQSAMRSTGASSPGDAVYASAMIRMAVGDYVELMGFQTDGTRNIKTGAGDCARVIAVQKAA